ncbi:hypothetical protein SAMN06296386_104230 [Lachnospiraceae bacterium]|nr:hypothetical protein SAMN06296386_104230 [Lachnospiraceae bacterium]
MEFYNRLAKSDFNTHIWPNSSCPYTCFNIYLDHPAKRAWAGLTYEQLCKNHISQIKKALGISGVLSEESIWSVKAGRDENGSEQQGAQIDLIIGRRDRVLNLCEIKFSYDEYEIDNSYDKILRNKIDRFVNVTGCKKSIQLTFITTYGVKKIFIVVLQAIRSS